MNLQRMMNLFILLFILINLALYLVTIQRQESYELTFEKNDLLIEVLEGNGMAMQAALPVYYPRAQLILWNPEDRESDLVEAMFGDNEAVDEQYIGNSHIHSYEGEVLTFSQETDLGYVYYSAENPTFVPEDFTRSSGEVTVNGFVSVFTLNQPLYEMIDYRDEDEHIYYYFSERFEEELLFCNEVVVKLEEKRGVTEARTIRYEPYAFEEVTYPLVPADEVLYRLMYHVMEDMEVEGLAVDDVSIGYYLGPDFRSDLSSYTVDPHYRVKLTAGEEASVLIYYINAYTNEIVEQ